MASTYLETSERRVNLPLAPPAGVRALTTKGPSAAATNRHACNPCPPSFCQPASRNGRSGDSQGVLATASVAVSSARGPSSVRFPHARGRELGTGIESSPFAPLGGRARGAPPFAFPTQGDASGQPSRFGHRRTTSLRIRPGQRSDGHFFSSHARQENPRRALAATRRAEGLAFYPRPLFKGREDL